jgi:hypothetical protein
MKYKIYIGHYYGYDKCETIAIDFIDAPGPHTAMENYRNQHPEVKGFDLCNEPIYEAS